MLSFRMTPRHLPGVLAMTIIASACAAGDESEVSPTSVAAGVSTVALDPAPDLATTASSVPPPPVTVITTPATTTPATTTPATTTPVTTTPATTASPTTINTAIPTTPISSPTPDDGSCVRQVNTGDTLESLVATLGGAVEVSSAWAENGFVDAVGAGGLVDICVDNAINDITGEPRARLDDPAVVAAVHANVERQQQKLNELLAPYGTRAIAVDGVSGPITGQRLCAARLALGFPASVDDMQPGSDEQAALFAAAQLPAPVSSALGTERWALIDRTCQMMFVGSGPDLVYVFPTSTGSVGFETRDQDRAVAFRYNPATENGGWHNSSEFPVGVDNPLNGNLYKPVYFDLGQAIHGANNVPPTPQSKGCARLSVADHTTLLTWLGLVSLTDETWLKDQINLAVSVQGRFVGRPA